MGVYVETAERIEMTDQEWEAAWWGSCANTFGEEAKQLTYAHKMGLEVVPHLGQWPVYDLRGATVIDLGGGPVSMLLKCVGGNGMVVDPCPYPKWVRKRYEAAEIDYRREKAEGFRVPHRWTECWIYNVLQHVEDPEQVIATARACAHTLRIFEWLETPAADGHPHTLHADSLNRWIDGFGEVGYVDENGATGLAYWGAFNLG